MLALARPDLMRTCVRRMYSDAVVKEVLALVRMGLSDYDVARRTGVSRATVLRWRHHPPPCPRPRPPIAGPDWRPADPAAYSYLFGVYLGDGCVSRMPRTWGLQISCDAQYTGIVAECRNAIEAVAPGVRVSIRPVRSCHCVCVSAYWNGWGHVFPQAGVGPKHKRPIKLVVWQQEVVSHHPWPFLRGLLHSDGCRSVNRVRVTLPSGRRAVYEYPRWYFVNASEDILQLFATTCARVGVRCTRSRERLITVSRRDAVALLDAHVGPKV